MVKLKQRNKETLTDEQLQARSQIVPGTTLYGYCCGYFGRDSYGDKTVISVNDNTVLVKTETGALNSADIDDWVALIESSNRWLAEER